MSADRPFERLSESQREAVTAFGADVAVSAAAGSGKTSVLVARFIHAVVKRGAAPDRILAITFTVPAADQMKRRLVREFARLGREADRRALENAHIGTIDGFCARVLRENPIEAGVDPYFTVLSDSESEILKAQVMDAVFEAQAERPLWLETLVERDEEPVREALLRLDAQSRAFGGDEKLLRLAGGAAERKALEARMRRMLLEVPALVGAQAKTGNERAALEAAARLPALLDRGVRDFEALDRARKLLKIDRMGKKVKDWAAELEPLARSWEGLVLEDIFAPQKAEFLRVFRAFRDAYDSEKRSRAALDFDDLRATAWKLFSGDSAPCRAARERYRERFSHIFVDEFQDTSPLQAQLIDLLRGKGNLFIVGDRQQSIYGFRYADPTLFSRYEAASGKRVALDKNYRARPAVIAFVNALFADAPDFRALVPGREFRLRGGGDVETLCVEYGPDKGPKDLDEARAAEAECLAARLQELVDSGTRVEDGTPGGRPLRWGDAAVLFRSMKKAPLYERALARRGIPFYSMSSRGFFDRPEVKDLVHLLTLIDHPDDDVALATALRSPFGGVSDDGLFWMARAAKEDDPRRPLSRALEAPGEAEGLSAADAGRAAAFRDFMASIRAARGGLPVSATLEKALAWSGYEVAALAGTGGVQRMANVRKLVEIARSLEERTVLDAAEFVRYVRGMAERDDEEAQARVEAEGGDAVLLSSIHSAKGLEFPLVAVADLGRDRAFRYRSFEAASPDFGFGWACPDPEDEKKKLADASYTRTMDALKARGREEETRLLYVAMTRAKERLILCGSLKIAEGGGPKNADTWMTHLAKFLKLDPAEDRPRIVAGVPVGVRFAAGEAVPVPAAPPASAARAGAAADADAILRRLVLPEKPYDLVVDLTVSDLLAAENEAEGGPLAAEEPDRDAAAGDDGEIPTPRNEYGTIFHKAMEVMVRNTPRGRAGGGFLKELLAPLTPGERLEMRAQIDAFWKGPLGQAVRQAPVCYPELPFIYKTPFGVLKGQLDLVYKERAGEWVVLDYKTNKIKESEIEVTARSYGFQLGLYALVFRKLMGEVPARGVLYFATPDRIHQTRYKEADFPSLEEKLAFFYQKRALFSLESA